MELKHFGVKGMRWGVRKDRRGKKRKHSEDYLRTKKLRKRDLSSLSNEEIRDLTNRLNLEQQFNRLNASGFTKTRRWVGKLMGNVGTSLVSQAVKAESKQAIKKTTGYDFREGGGS